MDTRYTRLKLACYASNVTMSIVGNLSPVLFTTFYSLYGISFSLLGLLVLINFVTQLTVDLVFSFLSHKINIPLAVKLTPYLSIIGLLVYALFPLLLPDHTYTGLVIGTLIFSAASGFNEVLISPVIAAIPSDDPDREMSKLHSTYAWGVVAVIIFATVFLFLFENKNWQYLAIIFALVPTVAAILFSGVRIPKMQTGERASDVLKFLKNKTLWLCVAAIFFGGAAECTMAQWVSGYLEQAFGIQKVMGDVFGAALFALALGTGRTLYAKVGKNISKVLFLGALGATVCYLVSALTSVPLIGLFACAFTGFCVSMLWPGSLIAASDRFPAGGVFLYAMMAAGGDFGAALGPQLVGIATDLVIMHRPEIGIFEGISSEQLGMKFGMLIGMIFPLIATFVFMKIMRDDKKRKATYKTNG